MGQPKKKGTSGSATNYISRAKALRKLQLSPKDFRRLCILKGIYPHEPKHKKLPGKGNSALKTYYYLKDIQFLAHEPLIEKFRLFKVFFRKLKKVREKNDKEAAYRVHQHRPKYKLDHIVKERYPTFVDAIRDLDDALCLCFLFATLPKLKCVPDATIRLCRRLTVEFLHYVIESRSLRKVFISIKGYYYQCDIQGQLVTWIIPHQFGYKCPSGVDFKVMANFVDFYSIMLGFVNFRLYNSLNLHYPPKIASFVGLSKDDASDDENQTEMVSALNQSLNRVVVDSVIEEEAAVDEFPSTTTNDPDEIEKLKREKEKQKRLMKLFESLKFFVGREVPREQLVFVIRCFGGQVSWDATVNSGSTFLEDDSSITHQIIDRPNPNQKFTSRYYVQPQWVFDCVNAAFLLPVEDYFPGCVLPPHLSPFVREEEGDYIPPEKRTLLRREFGINDEDGGSESEESEEDFSETKGNKRKRNRSSRKKNVKMAVSAGKVLLEDEEKKAQDEAAEAKRLAVMMIPKKKKRLYNKIVYGQKRKIREAAKLQAKRDVFEKTQKRLKKIQKIE